MKGKSCHLPNIIKIYIPLTLAKQDIPAKSQILNFLLFFPESNFLKYLYTKID